MSRNFLTQNLKILFAAHHFVFKSKDTEAIADVVNVKPSKVKHWMQSYEWLETLAYWRGYRPKEGDLGLAENLWTEMVQNSEDLNPVDYPDKAIKSPPDNPDVYALIQSHLFCVDDLCDDEIRARLAEEREHEGNPVRYKGKPDLENAYHWWIFPNKPEGLYSKCFARANVVGDLVIGTGDETSLVCIRHGRLTLTRQVSDDVVSVSDDRLLVCL